MKKILAFSLALVLCIGLCACGIIPFSLFKSSEEEKVPANSDPVQSDPSAPIADNPLPPQDVEPMQPTQSKEDEHKAHMSVAIGQWLLTEQAEGVPSQLSLTDSYRCTVDGAEYTWKFSYTNGSTFGIDVLEGEAVKYELSFPRYNGAERVMIIYTDKDRGVYINPAHYDIVQITPDNWLEYFQLKTNWYWDQDAFGDVTGLRGCNFSLRLKDEYIPRLSSAVTGGDLLTKNAMELSFSSGQQKCQIDLQNKTVTLIEDGFTFEKTETFMDNLYHHATLGYYELLISSGYTGPTGDTVPYLYDLTLLRADCPLYLLKDEFAIQD